MTNPYQPTDPDYATGDPYAVPGSGAAAGSGYAEGTPGTGVTSGAPDYRTEAAGSYYPAAEAVPTTGSSYATTGSAYPTTNTAGPTSSTAETAKAEAGQVKDTAVNAGQNVAQTAKEQAGEVVSETKAQASNLLHQARGEVSSQASTQLSRLAETLHDLSRELGSMASKSEHSGPMTDLVHQVSRKGGEVAHWLSDREPADVLDDVRRFARRRPFAFLGISFAAGLLAGRVTRGAVAANTGNGSTSGALTTGTGYRGPEFATTPSTLTSTYGNGAGTYPATDVTAGAGAYPVAGTTTAYPATGSYAGETEANRTYDLGMEAGSTTYGSGEWGEQRR